MVGLGASLANEEAGLLVLYELATLTHDPPTPWFSSFYYHPLNVNVSSYHASHSKIAHLGFENLWSSAYLKEVNG